MTEIDWLIKQSDFEQMFNSVDHGHKNKMMREMAELQDQITNEIRRMDDVQDQEML